MEEAELGKSLTDNIIRSLIRQGVIDVQDQDRTTEEIAHDVAYYLREILSGGINVVLITDHLENLQAKAKEFLDAEELDLACLLYATWIEHWINGLIISIGERKGLSRKDISLMVRELNFRAKSGWFLRLSGLGSIEREHLNRLHAIVEKRNEFVHYKWTKGINEDRERDEKRSLSNLLNQADATLVYLLEYENIELYGIPMPSQE